MVVWRLDRALTTAGNGQELADGIIVALRSGETVTLDFASVELITPSFANALIMTLLAAMSADDESHCAFTNQSDFVRSMCDQARERFARGIRLTNQRVASAVHA